MMKKRAMKRDNEMEPTHSTHIFTKCDRFSKMLSLNIITCSNSRHRHLVNKQWEKSAITTIITASHFPKPEHLTQIHWIHGSVGQDTVITTSRNRTVIAVDIHGRHSYLVHVSPYTFTILSIRFMRPQPIATASSSKSTIGRGNLAWISSARNTRRRPMTRSI